MTEYRVGWDSSSINFKGHSDWQEWDDPDASIDEIEDALSGLNRLCDGLEFAIEASGFNWWVETR